MKMRDLLSDTVDPLAVLAKRFEQAGMHKARVVEDLWLIHFSNKADTGKIARQGFTRGSPITTRDLSYTVGSNFKKPGINFAYPTDDERELRLTLNVAPPDAIVFRADGVRMIHWEDFEQVAFMGQDARRPFYQIRMAEDGRWSLISINGKPVKAGIIGSLFEVLTNIQTAHRS